MSNEYIQNLIYEAHAHLMIRDPKDKKRINEAIELLDNIDILAKEETKSQIKTKKTKIENDFNKLQEDIKKINDPFGHSKGELDNLKWKLKSYISMYNTLNRDNMF